MGPPDIDDIDRLFAHLQRTPPPPRLADDVLVAVAGRARARRRLGHSAIAAALALAAMLSFAVGQVLRTSGALALMGAVLGDVELAQVAPFEVAMALLELIPWDLGLLVALCLATVMLAARLALTPVVGISARRLER